MKPAPRLGAIFIAVLVDLVGFGVVMPFLAKEAHDAFGVSEFVATLLGSVYSLMQFLFVPVWGRVSDSVGRRPVLLWSIAGTMVSMTALGAGLAWGGSVLLLFAARAFSGIATANLGTASAYIADVTKPEERAKGMGLIGLAFGLGFIIGPAVGGARQDRDWRSPRCRAVFFGGIAQPCQSCLGHFRCPGVAPGRGPHGQAATCPLAAELDRHARSLPAAWRRPCDGDQLSRSR